MRSYKRHSEEDGMFIGLSNGWSADCSGELDIECTDEEYLSAGELNLRIVRLYDENGDDVDESSLPENMRKELETIAYGILEKKDYVEC